MTTKTKIILAKCIAFPVYFITMPISFVVGEDEAGVASELFATFRDRCLVES